MKGGTLLASHLQLTEGNQCLFVGLAGFGLGSAAQYCAQDPNRKPQAAVDQVCNLCIISLPLGDLSDDLCGLLPVLRMGQFPSA